VFLNKIVESPVFGNALNKKKINKKKRFEKH
jgi:hypothetical protein